MLRKYDDIFADFIIMLAQDMWRSLANVDGLYHCTGNLNTL